MAKRPKRRDIRGQSRKENTELESLRKLVEERREGKPEIAGKIHAEKQVEICGDRATEHSTTQPHDISVDTNVCAPINTLEYVQHTLAKQSVESETDTKMPEPPQKLDSSNAHDATHVQYSLERKQKTPLNEIRDEINCNNSGIPSKMNLNSNAMDDNPIKSEIVKPGSSNQDNGHIAEANQEIHHAFSVIPTTDDSVMSSDSTLSNYITIETLTCTTSANKTAVELPQATHVRDCVYSETETISDNIQIVQVYSAPDTSDIHSLKENQEHKPLHEIGNRKESIINEIPSNVTVNPDTLDGNPKEIEIDEQNVSKQYVAKVTETKLDTNYQFSNKDTRFAGSDSTLSNETNTCTMNVSTNVMESAQKTHAKEIVDVEKQSEISNMTRSAATAHESAEDADILTRTNKTVDMSTSSSDNEDKETSKDKRKRTSITREATPFNFEIDKDTWTTIKPVSKNYHGRGRSVRRLQNSWTDVFAEKTNAVYSGCVLAFKSHRVKAGGSRKLSGPFLVASAVCKGENCNIKFVFKVDQEPTDDVGVNVNCVVNGTIRHDSNEVNRRNVKGQRRETVAEQIKTSGTSNVFNENILNADEDQLTQGNFTGVPNQAVLRKIISENVKKETLHNNILAELQLLKDTFELEGAPYIHEIGLDPFCVILYSPQQISMLRKLSSENDLKIYLDATGSIINNIQNQKRPYLYSIVVKPNPTLPPLSLADMISTSHNIPKIQFFLSTVKRAVGLTGKQIKVKQVETDYSYALMQASLATFNHVTIKEYLVKCMDIIKCGELPQDFTVLHLCGRHMIRDYMRHLQNIKKPIRKFVYMAFAALQNVTSLQEALRVYTDVCVAFISKELSPRVRQAVQNIEKQFENIDTDIDDQEGPDRDDCLKDQDTEIKTDATIRDTSPFTPLFEKRAAEVMNEVENGKETFEENTLYSPEVIGCLNGKFIHLIPMWSGIMLHKIPSADNQTKSTDTNAYVESWFKYLKVDVKLNKRERPARFVIRNRKTVHARMLEHTFPRGREAKGKKKRKIETEADLATAEEVWSKKRKTKSTPKSKPRLKQHTKNDELPTVAKWGGKVVGQQLVNTCTVDNALTIMHLKFRESEPFQELLRKKEGSTYKTLLTVFTLMSEENFASAKMVWLNHIQKDANTQTNIFGDEADFFAGHFQQEWTSITISTCSCPDCPQPYAASRELPGFSTWYVRNTNMCNIVMGSYA
ncbi:MAG: hypothetical protein ABW185_24340 [Sedimenticola sp.]